MDSASEKKLASVHPLLAERVRVLVDALKPVEYRVVQGLRTFAEQDVLFAKHPKVTNARGGQSNHNYGLAVDLCPFVDGEFAWKSEKLFDVIGQKIHLLNLGLEWGGDWKFVDKPHVQLPGLTVSLCRELYNRGGLDLVWKKVTELNNGVVTKLPETEISASERNLKFGDKGSDVRALQVKLNLHLNSHIDVDGDFGKGTKSAVMEFQKRNRLDIDGIVGENTRKLLGL